MEGYEYPPNNQIPVRRQIKDPSCLSADIVTRLEIFGYTKNQIDEAFQPSVNYAEPHAIRATYYLLIEMIEREQTKQRRAKLTNSQAVYDSTSTLAHDVSKSQTSIYNDSHVRGKEYSRDYPPMSPRETAVTRVVPLPQARAASLNYEYSSKDVAGLTDNDIPRTSFKAMTISQRPASESISNRPPSNSVANSSMTTSAKFKEELRTVSGTCSYNCRLVPKF